MATNEKFEILQVFVNANKDAKKRMQRIEGLFPSGFPTSKKAVTDKQATATSHKKRAVA
ncbi:MAG: hypothetical protein HY938_11110 [Nitrosomonadales bacterium]|nr:hypothetical protein [Nitrosomonadales bacterium]